MESNKIFPIDYSENEIRKKIVEYSEKLDTDVTLTSGTISKLRRKIGLAQNQLINIEIAKNNNQLASQYKILQDGLNNYKNSIKKTAIFSIILIILSILSSVYSIYTNTQSEQENKNIEVLMVKNYDTNTKIFEIIKHNHKLTESQLNLLLENIISNEKMIIQLLKTNNQIQKKYNYLLRSSINKLNNN